MRERDLRQHKRLFRNVGWLTFGLQGANLLQLVFFTLLGRTFGDNQAVVGIYQYAMMVAMSFGVCAHFGLSYYLLAELTSGRLAKADLIGRVLALRMTSVLAMTVLGALYVSIFDRGLGSTYLWCVMFFGIHEALFQMGEILLAEFKADERMHVPALLMIGLKVASVSGSFIILLKTGELAPALAVLPVAALIFLGACLVWSSRTYGFPRPQFRRLGLVAFGALPFGVAMITNDILIKQETFVLRWFAPEDLKMSVVGAYTPAIKVLLVFVGMNVVLSDALMPVLGSLWQHKRESLVHNMTKLLRAVATVFFPISAGLYIVAEDFMVMWQGEAYFRSGIVLRIVAWSLILGILQTVLGTMLTVAGHQRSRTRIIALTLGVVIALNTALVLMLKDRAEVGVGVGRLVAEFLPLAAYALVIRRLIGPIPLISPCWRAAAASFIMVSVCVGLTDWPLYVDIPVGAAVYGVALLALGGLKAEDIRVLRRILKKQPPVEPEAGLG